MRGLKALRSVHYTDQSVEHSFFEALPCYPKQAKWIAQTHCRNSLFLGGIGTGKTTALVRKALLCALRQPGTDGCLLARTGRDTMQTILPAFFEALELYKQHTGVQLLKNFVRSEMRAVLEGGSNLLFRPYGESVDRLRGLNCSFMGVDEIEYARGDPRYIWDVISGRVRTGDPAKRQVFAATTPNGMRGLVAHFVEKQRAGAPGYYVAHSTIFDNPYLNDGHPCPDCDGAGCERCGNTGQASEYRDAVRASSSRRYWEQDGLGKVLQPVSGVFQEYAEDRHLIDWTFDTDLPFAVGIDWGESVAAAVLVQFVDTFTHDLEPGTWVVCDELIVTQCSREQFRQALLAWLGQYGAPHWAAADRAVPSENRWLRAVLHKTPWVKVCESKKTMRVRYGVEAMRSMLDPSTGKPRLFFARSLDSTVGAQAYGIRSQMLNYRYKLNPFGELSDEPLKDGREHIVDALRYLVVTSALHAPMHGGQALPFARLEGPAQSRDERYREQWDNNKK